MGTFLKIIFFTILAVVSLFAIVFMNGIDTARDHNVEVAKRADRQMAENTADERRVPLPQQFPQEITASTFSLSNDDPRTAPLVEGGKRVKLINRECLKIVDGYTRAVENQYSGDTAYYVTCQERGTPDMKNYNFTASDLKQAKPITGVVLSRMDAEDECRKALLQNAATSIEIDSVIAPPPSFTDGTRRVTMTYATHNDAGAPQTHAYECMVAPGGGITLKESK